MLHTLPQEINYDKENSKLESNTTTVLIQDVIHNQHALPEASQYNAIDIVSNSSDKACTNESTVLCGKSTEYLF